MQYTNKLLANEREVADILSKKKGNDRFKISHTFGIFTVSIGNLKKRDISDTASKTEKSHGDVDAAENRQKTG